MDEQALISALPDISLTESSFYATSYGLVTDASRSRLHTQREDDARASGWLAGTNTVGEWIQADLLAITHIYRVATQGRNNVNQEQWITTFQLKYSPSSLESTFEFLTSSPGGAVVTFDGNVDKDTVVATEFSPRVARFVRLYPLAWEGHIALRWELYGCPAGLHFIRTCNYTPQAKELFSRKRLLLHRS